MELLTKSWYTSHLRAIAQLVQEPQDHGPKAGEPILEAVVGSAELWPLPNEVSAIFPFIRMYMDGELLGETTVNQDQSHRPVWNERFLVVPRGSWCTRFEVCGEGYVRCHCALGTETVWKAAESMGRLTIDVPLLRDQQQVGVLHLHFRMWDGQPVQETAWWPEEAETQRAQAKAMGFTSGAEYEATMAPATYSSGGVLQRAC